MFRNLWLIFCAIIGIYTQKAYCYEEVKLLFDSSKKSFIAEENIKALVREFEDILEIYSQLSSDEKVEANERLMELIAIFEERNVNFAELLIAGDFACIVCTTERK